jgi:hypothetical protein
MASTAYEWPKLYGVNKVVTRVHQLSSEKLGGAEKHMEELVGYGAFIPHRSRDRTFTLLIYVCVGRQIKSSRDGRLCRQ